MKNEDKKTKMHLDRLSVSDSICGITIDTTLENAREFAWLIEPTSNGKIHVSGHRITLLDKTGA